MARKKYPVIRLDANQEYVVIGGKRFARIHWGDPVERWPAPAPSEHCHDCDVLPGALHGYGCDVETCPRGGGQMLVCKLGGCGISPFELMALLSIELRLPSKERMAELQ